MQRSRARAAMSLRWTTLALTLCVGAGLWSLAGCGSEKDAETPGESPSTETNEQVPNLPPAARRPPAPNFTLPDVQGNPVSLADHKGKVVLLNFWATWCGPCKKEIPDFMEMKRDYAGKDFEIIGISVDQDGPRKVEPFVQNAGINYPVLVNGGQISSLYGGVQSIPTTFVLDKQGRIVAQYVGLRPRKIFDDLAQALMKES